MVRTRKWVHEDSLMDQGQARVFPNDLPDKSPAGVKLGSEGERRFAPRVGCAGVMKHTEPGVSYVFVSVYTCCSLVLRLKCCQLNKVIYG